MEAGTLSAATSGRDAGKPCRFSRDRLYLNVGIRLRIAGGENPPSHRQGHGLDRGT